MRVGDFVGIGRRRLPRWPVRAKCLNLSWLKTVAVTAGIHGLILIALPARGGVMLTNLFSFDNLKSGYDPRPRLVQYTNGVLYGTTSGGGAHDLVRCSR